MYLTIKQIEHEMNIPGCYFYERALEKNVGLVVQADIKNIYLFHNMIYFCHHIAIEPYFFFGLLFVLVYFFLGHRKKNDCSLAKLLYCFFYSFNLLIQF